MFSPLDFLYIISPFCFTFKRFRDLSSSLADKTRQTFETFEEARECVEHSEPHQLAETIELVDHVLAITSICILAIFLLENLCFLMAFRCSFLGLQFRVKGGSGRREEGHKDVNAKSSSQFYPTFSKVWNLQWPFLERRCWPFALPEARRWKNIPQGYFKVIYFPLDLFVVLVSLITEVIGVVNRTLAIEISQAF